MKKLIFIRKGNVITETVFDNLITAHTIQNNIDLHFKSSRYNFSKNYYTSVFLEIIEPNVFYDDELTQKILQDELNKISHTEGLITENERIIY